MSNQMTSAPAPRGIDTVANDVSRMGPDAFDRMIRRADPTEPGLRKAQAVFWVGMAAAMAVMAQANDFL